MRPNLYPEFGSTHRLQNRDPEVVEANHLIDNFLRFVRDNEVCNDLIDEIELPVSKLVLVKAFHIAIASERRPQIRALLVKAGVSLCQYRPELGNRIRIIPVTPHGRPAPRQSRTHERRLEQALLATADERIRLGDLYQRACIESYH